MACPRKLYLREAKPQDDQEAENTFVPSPLHLASNSVNITNIACNSGVAVPLRLLAIEESVRCDVDECENNMLKNNALVCYMNHELFAHLYVTTEDRDASFKHYIIAFVEGTKIGRYEELIKILCHTISWLKIENKRPHFYIYYYGKQPVVETTLNEARNNITRSLRTHLKNYEKGEYFCDTSRVRTDATNFTIYDSNPYQFTVS